MSGISLSKSLFQNLLLCFLAVLCLGAAATGYLALPCEKVLIVGVPRAEQPAWCEFLNSQGIAYRLDTRHHTFYIGKDPVETLTKASCHEVLQSSAERALQERQLEHEFGLAWPNSQDPRICVAYPGEYDQSGTGKDLLAMVMVGGIPDSQRSSVQQWLAERLEGLTAERVIVLTTEWRPFPSYQNTPAAPSSSHGPLLASNS